MILETGKDEKGKYFKAGLIERYALTLDNYAGSEWGSRFYKTDFLEGFCQRRNEIHAQVARGSGALLITTTVLAFFDSVGGNVSLWGMTITVPELASLALCVLISINFFVLIGYFIDQLIIDRFLHTLGSKIGAYSFEIAVINLNARNLWVEAMTPRSFGLKSERGQKAMYTLILFLFIPFGLLFLAYPIVVVGVTISRAISESPGLVTLLLSGTSCFVFLFSIAVTLGFVLSYRFRSSGLSEPSEPVIPEGFIEMGHPIPNERPGGSNRPPQK